jgi:hypothetical protein
MDVYLVNAHGSAFDLSFTLLPLHLVPLLDSRR